MSPEIPLVPDHPVTCDNCQACCCRLEVMLVSETGVPHQHVQVDEWGQETMLRLEDGWCSALDRDTLRCTIYEVRPLICREFEMGSYECMDERAAHNTTRTDPIRTTHF